MPMPRCRSRVRAAMEDSAPPFAVIWDNPDDAAMTYKAIVLGIGTGGGRSVR